MNSPLSVIIPTFNRPDYLARTLRFLFRPHTDTAINVIVEDGSDHSHASLNRKECEHYGTKVRYFHVPPSTEDPWHNYNRRLVHSLDEAKTPYSVFCADDDLLMLESALEAVRFLNENSDYIACHGTYLQFRYSGNTINIESVAYEGESIDAESVEGRLGQMFSKYEAPFYAVFRTDVQARCFNRYMKVERPLWPEIYHSTAAIVEGKIARLPNIYSLRNAGLPPHPQAIDSFSRWMTSGLDDFNLKFRGYREAVMEWIGEKERYPLDPDRMKRVIDMAFMLYVTREFEPKFWLEEFTSLIAANDREGLRRILTERLLPTRNLALIDLSSPTATKEALKLAMGLTLGKKAVEHVQMLRNAIFRRKPIVPLLKIEKAPSSSRLLLDISFQEISGSSSKTIASMKHKCLRS